MKGVTELLFATREGNLEEVKRLHANGVDIHLEDEKPLVLSCFSGELDLVKYFVEHGAYIHAVNDYALRSASYNGHLEVVKYLVEQGAYVNVGDYPAIYLACDKEHLDVIMYLAEHSAIIDSKILKSPCKDGNFKIVKYLVDNHVNRYEAIEDAIQWSIIWNESEIVDYLKNVLRKKKLKKLLS